MSPTAASTVAAQITFTPGTVINRRAFCEPSASRGDQPFDGGDLAVEELDMA